MKLISNFIASEFKKSKISSDSDYLISAIFSDVMVSKGFDGILYPSVRTEGKGINVALTPSAVEKKMKLELAGICIIYKNKDIVVIDNLKNAIVGNNSKLEFVDVDPECHAGENECLKKIGVSSIEDLL